MREILFRGKRKDNGEWVEGFLYITHDGEYEIGCYNSEMNIERWTAIVDPATVGQYTGKTDRNGVKMFEDDIISDSHERRVIKWGEYECAFVTGDYYDNVLTNVDAECDEVIGNIHDNPEIEVEEYWL